MSDLYLSHFRNWVLSSPPAEWALNQIRGLLLGALRQGPIPRHVAFVMDGNRRYARSHKIEAVEGHHLGFEALARVLEICYKCGVQVVTVYAFSIENFKRPKYEVDGLMQLAKAKLEQLVQHGELLERYGASVRVCGQRDLISPDVLDVVDRAVDMTRHNTRRALRRHLLKPPHADQGLGCRAILNICFPYTSREEITTAMRRTTEEYSTSQRPHSTTLAQTRIAQKILSRHGETTEHLSTIREASPAPSSSRSDDVDDSVSSSATLHPDSPAHGASTPTKIAIYPNAETITADTVNSHTYTADCPPLDLFVRTSGVERLSDFMLWQCHETTQVIFMKCLWPEFDLFHFLPVLVEWQWRQKQKEREERPRRLTKMQ